MKITKHLSERNFLILAILWTIGVTVASLASLKNMPAISIPGNDKTAHFIFYFVFFVLWYFGLKRFVKYRRFDLILVLITLFYGICMEFFQAKLTANRQADFYDFLANSIGTLSGFFMILLYTRIRKLK
ncbi:VanZ family protein [Flavobacterium sp.]|uniref:VanZ family protein n=1 Tax=Flavobacterium sp. TaxID=239 RepID=UPI0037C16E88